MVRPSQLLHVQREPAPTRPAATVLLLRDTSHGVEVLMTPATYAIVHWIKRHEGEDHYDRDTHFTPFSLADD